MVECYVPFEEYKIRSTLVALDANVRFVCLMPLLPLVNGVNSLKTCNKTIFFLPPNKI